MMIRDDKLQTRILPVVRSLLQDSQRLEEMRKVMHSVARPDAPEAIATLLLSLAGRPAQES
jgi:UDP-N-acetylglucosamine:LPS N-acetylglucosamine transferase